MQFKNNPDSKTLKEIEKVLRFIREHSQGLVEKPGDSKWTEGNCLFSYQEDEPGFYTFMVGALKSGNITWHMMPMYGVSEMKEKWAEVLSPHTSGKSCIQFNRFDDLPREALLDIVRNGTPMFQQVMLAHRARKK